MSFSRPPSRQQVFAQSCDDPRIAKNPIDISYTGAFYLDRMIPLQSDGLEAGTAHVRYRPAGDLGAHFRRLARHADLELAEMSIAFYLMMRGRGDSRLVGLPVFPSRSFRHNQVYVRRDAGIDRPEDLRGRRVGVTEYHMTAALWIRAFLQHDYGVGQHEIVWRTRTSLDEAAELGFPLPGGTDIATMPDDLEWGLEEGELDALVTSSVPRAYAKESSKVRRLFEGYREVEEDYYRRTRLFPIMHLVVLRRDIYESHPWLAVELTQAFESMRIQAMRRLSDLGTLAVMHPWIGAELSNLAELFAGDPFSYGVARNQAELEAISNYAFEQGLTPRTVGIEELFAPTTLGWSGSDFSTGQRW
jgi:4,5-dihydroxyphthalate decarboxylase